MKIKIDTANRTLDSQTLAQISDWVIEQSIAIQQIPAPTFAERPRAEAVAALLAQHNLSDISIDDMHNVYSRLPGANPDLPALMVVAHTDTVFPAETDLTVRREPQTIHGPGIGDNSFGVGGLLGVVRFLHTRGITPDRDIWFVATSCEEGLGDLRGMRAAFNRLKDKITGVINLEGLAYGHVYHAGIAVKRLKITCSTGGGHSWLHFGRPSAIHALTGLAARISTLKTPENPRTTYNIGLIEGGTSINSIAASATLWLDMRSEKTEALDALETEVRRMIGLFTGDDIGFTIDVVGARPAGYIAPTHPLVRAAIESLSHVGVQAMLETGSTDGNISLAAGCPTVTVGVTRGGNAHRTDEYAEVAPVRDGMRQLITLTLAASDKAFPFK